MNALGLIVMVGLGVVGLALLLSLPLFFAWTYVMSDVFHAPHLTWLQSFALGVVSSFRKGE